MIKRLNFSYLKNIYLDSSKCDYQCLRTKKKNRINLTQIALYWSDHKKIGIPSIIKFCLTEKVESTEDIRIKLPSLTNGHKCQGEEHSGFEESRAIMDF